VARFSLLNRIGRGRSSEPERAASPLVRRAPSPGALRRERRAILKAREERIRDLGGLTLEMYRRSSFRDELLIEQCREIVALEERLNELDSMLSAVASARRAPSTCECGAPVPWGSHFCANCGRPVGTVAIVACESCGHPLPADAQFCASCGKAASPSDQAKLAEAQLDEGQSDDAQSDEVPPADEPEPEPAPAADSWER
jgi:double zinc ribbon protein